MRPFHPHRTAAYSIKKRANYQILVWRKSLVGNQDLPEPQCSGWKEEDGVLCPILMTSDPAPESIIELTTCNSARNHYAEVPVHVLIMDSVAPKPVSVWTNLVHA